MARRKIVYLLQCHNSAAQVRQLFAALYSPHDIFLIHPDRKCPSELSHLAGALTAAYRNVHLLERKFISWGGYSQVNMLLCAIAHSLSLDVEWSHIVVLSEQHMPLWPPDQIAARLPIGESLIEYNKVSEMPEGGRLDVHHRFDMQYRELPGVGPLIDGIASLPDGFLGRLYHGSNWFVLARDACRRLDSLHASSDLVEPFRNSLQADETLVPSLLFGTPLGDSLRICNRNATFVAYPHLSGTPDLIFTESNFFAAVAKDYLFIRKRPDVLPASVEQFLETRSGLTKVELQRALAFHEPGSEVGLATAPPNIEGPLMQVVSDVERRFPGIVVSRVNPNVFSNVPRVYLLLQHPSWSPKVLVGLLSEDAVTFKVIVAWEIDSRNDLDPIIVGNYCTFITKLRVHRLAFTREVFVHDEPAHGFIVVETAWDWDRLTDVVCIHLHHASIFSSASRAY